MFDQVDSDTRACAYGSCKVTVEIRTAQSMGHDVVDINLTISQYDFEGSFSISSFGLAGKYLEEKFMFIGIRRKEIPKFRGGVLVECKSKTPGEPEKGTNPSGVSTIGTSIFPSVSLMRTKPLTV